MARLLTVHAHPDDEASKGAPTVAKYVSEGHEAYLVCATDGAEGDVLNPAMDRDGIKDKMVEIRRGELEASVAAIGFHRLVWMGYRDSGMAGSESNAHPECFAQADLDDAVGRLVATIREMRPHVMITYADDQQGYQHPDHLQVHDVSVLAYARAADPDWKPDLGDPWQPSKLYYSVWSQARMRAHHEKFEELGLESPYVDPRWLERPSLDHRITTKVDIAPFYPVRRAALLAHATQIDPNERFWFGLPDEAAAEAYPYEDYILSQSQVGPLPAPGNYETDLFAGIDGDD